MRDGERAGGRGKGGEREASKMYGRGLYIVPCALTRGLQAGAQRLSTWSEKYQALDIHAGSGT